MATHPSVEFVCAIVKETDDAFLVFEGDKKVWISKSQVIDYEQVETGKNAYEFIIPEWLAIKKEIV